MSGKLITPTQAEIAALKGNKKLKNEGGKGQDGVGIIDGSVLTIRETGALAVAKDLIDDAKRHEGKALKDIPLGRLMDFLGDRTAGRPFSDEEVLAEVARLQNHEIYQTKVARR